jgi:integrase/recombinase XerD
MEAREKKRWQIGDLIQSYAGHLESLCGLRNTTRDNYCRYVREFLAHRYGGDEVDLSRLGPGDLIRFISDRSVRCHPRTTQRISTALRSFLRFLQFQGLCEAKLVGAVPTVPIWAQAEIPRSLTEDQLQRLLAAFDRQEPIGRRDYAIALCLCELGLRAGEAARLTLGDLDWRGGTLRVVAGKTTRSSLLPLTRTVGRAIAAYLRRGRGATQERRVFVRPTGAPMESRDISSAMRRAFDRAGIEIPVKGAHVLRHTAATRMIRRGVSLKEIADVLRHQDVQTTTIYAKVDLPALAQVAMAWPGEPAKVHEHLHADGKPKSTAVDWVMLAAVAVAWPGVHP